MSNESTNKTIHAVSHFFASIFGNFNWSSPPWAAFLQQKARKNPLLFMASCLLLLLVIAGSCYAICWYKNLPKPQLITTSITPPQITPLSEELLPNPLVIDFGYKANEFIAQSVAPLKLVGQEVSKGITLSPSFQGKWRWDSDSRLVFNPDGDWPAGQTYQVRFANNVFAPQIKMQAMQYEFTTQPFVANITDLKFYQDPSDAKAQEAVATIEFNFPVDAKSLQANTQLMLGTKPLTFKLSYDPHQRTAYVHSERLSLSKDAQAVVLTIHKGVKSQTQSTALKEDITRNLLIPDSSHYFKINTAVATILRNEQDRPEQVLTLETTLGASEAEINKGLHVYVLPINYPATKFEAEKNNYTWQNPGEVTPAILAASKPLVLQTIPADSSYATLHSFKFSAKPNGFLYLKLAKGTKGFGDYPLAEDYAAIIKVPEFPKEISFLHKGALLALSSEKKLSVLVRGVPAVKFQMARVLPDNINQLITQTQGNFDNPYFINQSFTQQNISEIFSEIQTFDISDLSKQQYSYVDLGKYLATVANTGENKGLFLLQAIGWDQTNNVPLETQASRLVLITDNGMLVKDNVDGTHDVFVQSIISGTPSINTAVSVLGKNGLPILTQQTDSQGRATFPTLKDFIDDREPVVYVARSGSDVSFIPYNNINRQLNFTRFDIEGIYTYPELQNLSAFIFTDRGIYRPGDTAHAGFIVKQTYAANQPAGLPLQATIIDARGTTILDKKVTLDASGYFTVDLKTSETSPTGQYTINLYTIKDSHPENMLGSTSFKVAEFLPDRMKIGSRFSQSDTLGWISPTHLTVNVELANLYGAPAENRRVAGKMILSPQVIHFDQYPDYLFADPLLNPSKPPKVFTENLADVKTNAQGKAQFKLNLDRFDNATYQLTFYSEGFEAEGGRSVTHQITSLVSPLAYLIGYKADGDLTFIKQNSQRAVNFIAVNPQLKQQTATDLKIQRLVFHPITTLVKKEDGTYQYQSILQSSVVDTQAFTVQAEGTNYPLVTDQIGDYAVVVLDAENHELSRLRYSVVGRSQTPLAKNAELSVKLDKQEYRAGDDIEIQITSPYVGAGLITIERDKVYATQWFKTDMTNSVQHIHVPADLQGNAYINVAFVRGWDSDEIFMSPLSYSVVPFTINHDSHAQVIHLDVPAEARPGDELTIRYNTDKPGKIIVYAVDEGILQVARYATPDPLDFFFQKRALEVVTQQTLDQILPQYIRERELSAVGGDDGEAALASHLNPFKRKTDLPVVFWSGILDTDSSEHSLNYTIPNYFNGSLKVMAVAVADNAVGSQAAATKIKGDFIISPNVPTFVAPNDEFEITSSIANNVKNSGNQAPVNVHIMVSPELQIMGDDHIQLAIDEDHEKTVHFKLKARELLGSAKITWVATLNDKTSEMDTTLSVRPLSTYVTSINSGTSKDAAVTLPVMNQVYSAYRKADAVASNSPLILVLGLQHYLDNFPFGCTEQLVSKAMPLLSMQNLAWFKQQQPTIEQKLMDTLQLLSARQMSTGGFSYWPNEGDNLNNDFASVYAMHFLTEANQKGYTLPNDLFYGGMGFLKDLAARTPQSMDDARNQAYAIYVLTRNEIVTTNYLTNLQAYLDTQPKETWEHDVITAYLATTYRLLKSNAEADRLIQAYKPTKKVITDSDFYNQNTEDAEYLYLLVKHFPERVNAQTNQLLLHVIGTVNNQEINTLLASYVSLVLDAYTENKNTLFEQTPVPIDISKLELKNPGTGLFFYQLMQSAFEKSDALPAIKNGIEIFREYRSLNNEVITTTQLGDEVEVHIKYRSLDNTLANIAITDLLPGGFEVVNDSILRDDMDYVDVREDRVVFFTYLTPNMKEIVYRIKSTNPGKYQIPPIFAESMYNPAIKGRGTVGEMLVDEK